MHILPALLLAAIVPKIHAFVVNKGTECHVYPESLFYGGHPVDDTPSILQAFELCGTNGSVIFTDHTFNIDQVMNTTNLLNCDVSLHGELLWSTNIPYWLSHGYFITFQNLTTAWLFGGTNVTFRGYGKGVLNGQGRLTFLRLAPSSPKNTAHELYTSPLGSSMHHMLTRPPTLDVQDKRGTTRTATIATNRVVL